MCRHSKTTWETLKPAVIVLVTRGVVQLELNDNWCHYLGLSPESGIFLFTLQQLLKKRSSQFRAFGPMVFDELRSDVVQGDLPFFSAVIPSSSSATVKALVNPMSSG